MASLFRIPRGDRMGKELKSPRGMACGGMKPILIAEGMFQLFKGGRVRWLDEFKGCPTTANLVS